MHGSHAPTGSLNVEGERYGPSYSAAVVICEARPQLEQSRRRRQRPHIAATRAELPSCVPATSSFAAGRGDPSSSELRHAVRPPPPAANERLRDTRPLQAGGSALSRVLAMSLALCVAEKEGSPPSYARFFPLRAVFVLPGAGCSMLLLSAS